MASGLLEKKGGLEKMEKLSPNQRLGKKEDIAGLVVFLASRAASHLNGAVVVTDGGSMLQSKL